MHKKCAKYLNCSVVAKILHMVFQFNGLFKHHLQQVKWTYTIHPKKLAQILSKTLWFHQEQ